MDIEQLAILHAPTMRKYDSYKKWARVHLRAVDTNDYFKKAFECVCQDGEVIAPPLKTPEPAPEPKKKRKARKKKAATPKQAAK